MTHRLARYSPRLFASVAQVERQTTGMDDDQERRVRLLLLGKEAVFADRSERPVAAEMDDKE
jgi:hypothetical protein